MKGKVIEEISNDKIIAILRGSPKEKLIPVAQALYDGGIRVLEITYSANGSVSDEETAENIKLLSEHFEDKMYIGAGTVLTPKQVKLTKANGGLFVISPNTDKEVIEETISCGLVSIPGALTPSEVTYAHKCGADFVKLVPVTSLGAEYVKAIRAPLSHIKLLAVGGINKDNMKEYLLAGVCGFGIGSNITDKKMIAAGDWDGIMKLAKEYVEAAKNA